MCCLRIMKLLMAARLRVIHCGVCVSYGWASTACVVIVCAAASCAGNTHTTRKTCPFAYLLPFMYIHKEKILPHTMCCWPLCFAIQHSQTQSLHYCRHYCSTTILSSNVCVQEGAWHTKPCLYLQQRALHFFSECQRVFDFVAACRKVSACHICHTQYVSSVVCLCFWVPARVWLHCRL